MAEIKKLKIGILTFHYAQNYGAVLQCYALQKALEEYFPNTDIFVVDYRNQKIVQDYAIFHLRNKNLYRKLRSLIGGVLYLPQRIKCKSNFKTFVRKNLNIGSSTLSEYDAIFYGSDQIWNPKITGGVEPVYFGQEFDGIKIAYAASDGGKLEVTSEIKGLLQKFSALSVREKSTAKKFAEIGIRSSIVCDPVFLLSVDEWRKVAVLPREKNYVFAYKVSENPFFDAEAEKIGKKLGKEVIQAVYVKNRRKFFCKSQKIIQGISPFEFIGYIAAADFVLTTSFHGTAFSTLFMRPFCVLEIDSGSERITELLEAVGLEKRYGRLVSESDSASADEIYTAEVKEKIAMLNESGTKFLESFQKGSSRLRPEKEALNV